MRVNHIIIFFVICIVYSACKKDCGECFTYAEPFRISIIDSSGNNRLESNSKNLLEIDKIIFKTGPSLEFQLTNLIDNQFSAYYYYINSIDNNYLKYCIQQDCEMYIYYKNNSDIDTINIFIDHIISTRPNGCNCTSYPTKYFKFNGAIITTFDNEHNTGSKIIIKN